MKSVFNWLIQYHYKCDRISQEYKRSKHIDIKYHWLKEHTYENGTVDLEHCSTKDMVADMMTKALAFDLHVKHAKNSTGYIYGDI